MKTRLAGKLGTASGWNLRSITRLCAAIIVCLTFITPVILSEYDYSALQIFLTMLLLDVCLYPSYRYIMRGDSGVPVLQLLCLSYAVQFALPIFTRDPIVELAYDFAYLDNDDVVIALVMVIIGVIMMQLAFYVIRIRRISNALPSVSLPLNVDRALVYCISIFFLSLILGPVQSFLLGKDQVQFSSIIGLLQNQVLVAIGILCWIVYTRGRSKWLKVLLYVIVLVTIIRGASTAMLESVLVPIIVLFITRWIYTRRVPIVGFIVIGLMVLFLSPAKFDLRRSVAVEREAATESTTTNRVFQWVELATDYWVSAFTQRRDFLESASDTTSRTDLIHQFAYIYASTPSLVPYQYGGSYKYFVVALIPRALWPGKPEANSVNNFYAINYGISTEQVLERSTFGVSLIGEGYMNFGVFGVLLAMALQGLIISLLEHLFAGENSGAGGKAIFLASLVFFLNGIGSSAEIMFGSVFQSMICACVLLWWAREPQKSLKGTSLGFIQSTSYR
ncbi:MAG: hypothetical protein WBP93_09255 [Pyrinomonadaceae bacterium]